jgi:hypothetical protein
MSELLQIHLNSKNADRFINGTSDIEFDLPLIEAPLQHTIYLSVQHLVIPYSFYNIDSNNNFLNYIVGETTYNIYIETGNYNPYQLINVLQNIMQGFTITYDSIKNKFTFSNNYYEFGFLNTSTCLRLIGFENTIFSVNKTVTSINSINLQSHHCVCVQSNLLTGSINSANKYESNIICSVPVDKPPFSMITYTNHNNLKYNLFNNVISTMRLKLTDQNNNLIDLNGCNWSCTVQLEIIKFVE